MVRNQWMSRPGGGDRLVAGRQAEKTEGVPLEEQTARQEAYSHHIFCS